MTEIKVKQVTAKALTQRGKISKEDIKDIIEEKKQVIARSEILEFFDTKSNQDDIGGLNVLKVWLNQRYRPFLKKLETMDYLFQRESYSLEHKEQENHLQQNQFLRVGRCASWVRCWKTIF